MTAFARAVATLPGASLAWELKSVNAKGLDLRLRLPPGFDAQEAGFRALIGAAATRGSVNATLNVQRAAAPPQVRIDRDLLASLLRSLQEAVPANAPVAPASLDGLLAVRGVVEVVEQPDSPAEQDALARAALDVLRDALDAFTAMRCQEGEALGGIMFDQLAGVQTLVRAAEAAPGRTPEAVAARLRRAVEGLLGASPALDRDRLHQEAVLLATRSDVREEIDRLAIHAAAAANLVAAAGPVGRRLDFLAQEMAREANTLCAKSNDAGLTAIGLDLRNRIEQFREQVQNLE